MEWEPDQTQEVQDADEEGEAKKKIKKEKKEKRRRKRDEVFWENQIPWCFWIDFSKKNTA